MKGHLTGCVEFTSSEEFLGGMVYPAIFDHFQFRLVLWRKGGNVVRNRQPLTENSARGFFRRETFCRFLSELLNLIMPSVDFLLAIDRPD